MRRDLEQVFLRPRGGAIEALVVVERESGARERAVMPLPHAEPSAAADTLGRQLARSGAVDRVRGVRLRVERAGALRDDAPLAARLVAAFEAERRRAES